MGVGGVGGVGGGAGVGGLLPEDAGDEAAAFSGEAEVSRGTAPTTRTPGAAFSASLLSSLLHAKGVEGSEAALGVKDPAATEAIQEALSFLDGLASAKLGAKELPAVWDQVLTSLARNLSGMSGDAGQLLLTALTPEQTEALLDSLLGEGDPDGVGDRLAQWAGAHGTAQVHV